MPPRITQINIVAKDFDATSRFYSLLGLEVPKPTAQPPGALHAEVNAGHVQLGIDNDHLARIYNAAARRDAPLSRAIIGVTVASRAEVDEMYGRLVIAGYQGLQAPYDAFWGARFAIVADPDGNNVGLMSPPDPRHGFWPPVNSPD